MSHSFLEGYCSHVAHLAGRPFRSRILRWQVECLLCKATLRGYLKKTLRRDLAKCTLRIRPLVRGRGFSKRCKEAQFLELPPGIHSSLRLFDLLYLLERHIVVGQQHMRMHRNPDSLISHLASCRKEVSLKVMCYCTQWLCPPAGIEEVLRFLHVQHRIWNRLLLTSSGVHWWNLVDYTGLQGVVIQSVRPGLCLFLSEAWNPVVNPLAYTKFLWFCRHGRHEDSSLTPFFQETPVQGFPWRSEW